MISNSEFQLVCVSVPISALGIRAIVVKELNGTVYTVFFAPRVMVASHVIYATLNSLIKQTLESFDLLSMLEPGNSRQDRDFRDRDQDCFVETETRDFLLKIRDFETFYKILTTREKLRDFLGKI